MTHSLLITSFDTWLPHQKSNASDDLLLTLEAQGALPLGSRVLHRLPVCVDRAFAQICAAIATEPTDIIVCCGMAEQRSRLNFELRATDSLREHWTSFSWAGWYSLRNRWQQAEISYDAGRFVCNGLYARVLSQGHVLGNPQSLFVHVPPLRPHNQAGVVSDFRLMLSYLTQWDTVPSANEPHPHPE